MRQSLAFETLVGDLLATFLRLPAAEVDGAIEHAQRGVCELLGLQHSALWQWTAGSPPRLVMTHLHRSMGEAIRPSPEEGAKLFPWIHQELLASREVVLGSLDELPPAASWDRENVAAIYGIKSLAILPLASCEDLPVGALTFADLEQERIWSEGTLRRLRLVGTIFAAAIARRRSDLALAADASERKMAEEALRDLSQRLMRAHEEERALLARELHDDLSQRLAVLAIDVGVAELETHEEEQASRMRAVRENLVRLSEDVHSLSYQLHPSILDELGLAEALEAEAAQFRKRSTAAMTTRLPQMTRDLGRDEALCLFRVAQEALHNSARHAGANTVSLELFEDDGGWMLTVADDGIGFDQAAARRRASLGLESMGERVRLVRGRLALDSAPGRGTMIGVWVPAGEASE